MNQPIVLNLVDWIKQIQYIIVLNKIIDATNIFSRVFNNRFCVFLKTQQITYEIIYKYSTIYIDFIEIPTRKLINPFKCIIRVISTCPKMISWSPTPSTKKERFSQLSMVSFIQWNINGFYKLSGIHQAG